MERLLFELSGVYFSYLGKIPALCGVSLAIKEAKKVAIIGANGTGKSTLLAMLDALIFPDKGVIKAFGRELEEGLLNDPAFSRPYRNKVGFVFQNPEVQLFCPTVKEEIVFGPLQLGVRKIEIERRLEKLVSIFKIASLLERPHYQLSIGEKKKVSIASVLAVNPEVLLLDEPTGGLDPQTSRDIIDIILEENQAGKTIVIATHDLHIVEEIADIVYVMGEAKNIVHSGSPSQILSNQGLLQENNLIHAHHHRHKEEVHTHPHLHQEHHF